MRNKLANFLFRRGMYKTGCLVRGRHMGIASLGRCLACGKTHTTDKATISAVQMVRLRERQIIETTYQRNQRIRQQARVYGL